MRPPVPCWPDLVNLVPGQEVAWREERPINCTEAPTRFLRSLCARLLNKISVKPFVRDTVERRGKCVYQGAHTRCETNVIWLKRHETLWRPQPALNIYTHILLKELSDIRHKPPLIASRLGKFSTGLKDQTQDFNVEKDSVNKSNSFH